MASTPSPPGRFHRKVALQVALVTAGALALLLVAIYLLGRTILSEGLQLRAEGVARTVAVAAAGERADLEPLAGGARRASPGLLAVTVRQPDGAVLAREVAPDAGPALADAATVRVGIPAGPGRAAGGTVEVAIGQSALVGLLNRALGLAAALGAALVVAAALGGAALGRRLVAPVDHVADGVRRLAKGDLRVALTGTGSDELAVLAQRLDLLATRLRDTLGDLRQASGALGAQATTIAGAARKAAEASAGHAAGLDEAAARIGDITQASRMAAEAAQLVIDVADRAERLWVEGERAVREGTAGLVALEEGVGGIAAAVTELSERTVQIAGIIATVKDLSEQSNVLALNAAIEAAKVGEEGKGFALVADQMRRLAEQSRRATDQVRAMLGELQRATRRVVSATADGAAQARVAVESGEQAAAAIGGLATALGESSRAARGIADTSRGQAEEMEAVVAAVEYLLANLAATLAEVRRSDEAARALRDSAALLEQLLSRYEI